MIALPEAFLACAGMALLMVGVFRKEESVRFIILLTEIILVIAVILVMQAPEGRVLAFDGLYLSDDFASFMKILALLGAGLTLAMSLGYIEREQMARFEFPVLLLFATLGMMMMISANDLISLYLGLELQSLSLYVVAAFRRDTVRSSEAGLKYFVLGALSSGMLLYGCSLVYGFSGTTSFDELARILTADTEPSLGLIVGLVFVITGLAFKVSAVPFHMWTPDVYEGAPTPVTAFFATAPKIAAVALFVRVMMGPFGGLFEEWQQVVIVISVGSMALGAFAAIMQSNIKRLMAYSSIGHMGYVLIGLATGTEKGIGAIGVYMAIYLVMNLGVFACILCMRRDGLMVEQIDDLKGLAKTSPLMALALGMLMFSMAGIPPLAGFFGKLLIFQSAVEAGLYTLAVIGVLTSVVAAFYYLRIVKIMYFDEPADAFDTPLGGGLKLVILGSSLAMLVIPVALNPFVTSAGVAAAALMAG
ncbi:MAG: NADH-quinone oxidoreductase subunit NuoN [Kiloniellales bacterium]|nr:NADH-quinone oxidoreductase subunit NuoN [Kiloniellales bacterium]